MNGSQGFAAARPEPLFRNERNGVLAGLVLALGIGFAVVIDVAFRDVWSVDDYVEEPAVSAFSSEPLDSPAEPADASEAAYFPALATNAAEQNAEAELEAGSPLREGEVRDCEFCPVMVLVPGGTFRMGDDSAQGFSSERPQHEVQVAGFALAVHEVTRAEYALFSAETGSYPSVGPSGEDSSPVTGVSWNDAQEYARWASARSGVAYRLPTEAEWEYAARGGSTSQYPWGDMLAEGVANCDGCGGDWENTGTAPVMSFHANQFGLFDMHGNVWEWVEDCFKADYEGVHEDGSAWTVANCQRVARGGGWNSKPLDIRSATRSASHAGIGYATVGFRLARDIPAPAQTVTSAELPGA